MSYFALVKATDGKSFDVPHCHVNLWSLPGAFERKIYLDVGVHIVARENGLKAIDIALPFLAEIVADVSMPLRDRVTSQLIFRRESVNGRITFSDAVDLQISQVNEEQCKEGASREKDRSLWHISLPEMNNEEQRYFRIRFPVRHRARMWNIKRHGFLTYGALLDFRVADTREAPGDPDWDSVRDRVVPIGDLQFFVIAPLSLQLQTTSPPLYTSRILEGDSWEKYLRRKTYGERLVIYQWNKDYPSERPTITTTNPYRIFLNLSREVMSVSVPVALQSTVVTLVIALGCGALVWWSLSVVDITHLRSAWTKWFTGLTVTGVVGWLASKIKAAKPALQTVEKAASAIDNWRYGCR